MKPRSRHVAILVLGLATACNDGSGPPANPVASVQLNPHDVTLGTGVSLTLGARVIDADGNPLSDSGLMWASRNGSRVDVNASGVVTGLDTGSTYVIASVGNRRDSALITVRRLSFASIWTGPYHTCGITTQAELYCWGFGEFGQLGNGTTSNVYGPVRVASVLPFVAVTEGYYHTCGRTATGEVYCWGSNTSGQLGIGRVDGVHALPQRAAPNLLFADVRAGTEHTCGVTPAGVAYCWGAGVAGQLGTGTRPMAAPSPLPVAGGLTFRMVGGGNIHSCGLAADSTVYCWGYSVGGVLGIGQVNDQCGGDVFCASPVSIIGDRHFAQLEVGFVAACGLTRDGAAYCWGADVGDTATAVPGGLTFSAVTVGSYHRCGLVGADAYCWGMNTQGELGTGNTTGSPAPSLVTGGHSFAIVSAGAGFSDGYTCALTTSNVAYCWGANALGRLGLGQDVVSRDTPTKVLGQP